jgi:uncharacterized protein (TIGR00661 family)
MSRAKILYAFNGTGYGHTSRAMSIIPLLKNFCDVDILISGEMNRVDIKQEIRYRFEGFTFVYDKGGVSYFKTFLKLKLFKFLSDIRNLPVDRYDLVISDFEPISAYAAKLRKKRSLALSHHAAFLSDKTPRPLIRDRIAEWILKNYAPCTNAIGFHFNRYDNFILKPHLRKEVINIRHKTTTNPFVLVYLSAYTIDQLIQTLSNIRSVNFIIISTKGYKGEYGTNIKVEPANPDKFVELLSSCMGVITGGGFETVAEAMYLGKPVLTVPIQNQYEQFCNAVAAAAFKGVVVGAFTEKHLNGFIAMIKFTPFLGNEFNVSSDETVIKAIEQYVYQD